MPPTESPARLQYDYAVELAEGTQKKIRDLFVAAWREDGPANPAIVEDAYGAHYQAVGDVVRSAAALTDQTPEGIDALASFPSVGGIRVKIARIGFAEGPGVVVDLTEDGLPISKEWGRDTAPDQAPCYFETWEISFDDASPFASVDLVRTTHGFVDWKTRQIVQVG